MRPTTWITAGLRDYLEGRFKDTRAIRYEIRYRRVSRGRRTRFSSTTPTAPPTRSPGSKGTSGGTPSPTIASSSCQIRLRYKILAGM